MAKYFNNNIKHLRTIRGLSQEEVSNGSGIERSVLSRIENAKIETSIDNAWKLSSFFKVPIDILISRDLRLEENVVLDENHKLDLVIQDKSKDLTEDGKKALINIIDNLSSIDNK